MIRSINQTEDLAALEHRMMVNTLIGVKLQEVISSPEIQQLKMIRVITVTMRLIKTPQEMRSVRALKEQVSQISTTLVTT